MILPARVTLETIFRLIYLLVLVRVVLSWVPVRSYHPAVRLVHRVTEPMLRPFRRLLPPWRTGGLDLSPMLLIVLLWAVEQAVVRAILGLVAYR
jgi:YggT family protein